jgi:hypothetical protein
MTRMIFEHQTLGTIKSASSFQRDLASQYSFSDSECRAKREKTKQQIADALKGVEAGLPAADICRDFSISTATLYKQRMSRILVAIQFQHYWQNPMKSNIIQPDGSGPTIRYAPTWPWPASHQNGVALTT